MQAEIITVGTELLLGDIVDSNTQFLSRELAAQGISVLHQSTVGDNPERLKELLCQALDRSDTVLIAGGLGPTQDDLTKETVCDALQVELTLHPESWQRIVEYFENTGREMTASNRKQAMLPVDATVFQNDHGTAPGMAIEKDGRRVILLPGPPRELIPMFNDYVSPYLAQFSQGGIYSYTVGVFGMPEAAVGERIADLMESANPTVAPYAKDGEVLLRVTARAADEAAARDLCEPILTELQSRLGACVYGINAGSLPKVVVNLLKEKELKIATAESCTAGLLSGRITEVPGASEVFECGVAAYSCDIKHHLLGVPQELLDEHGAVSAEVAQAMAIGVRRVSHASLGVGITGVAGPEPSENKPVGTVYMALADDKRVWVKKIVAGHGGEERDYIRHIAVLNALDLTRRYLEAMPTVMAGGERIADTPPDQPVIPSPPAAGERLAKRRFTAFLLAVMAILAALLCCLVYYILPPVTTTGTGAGDGFTNPTVEQEAELQGLPMGAPGGILPQFYDLYSQNADIAGSLTIEGTAIRDLPILKRAGQADYYRFRDFEENNSDYGSLYFGADTVLFSADSVNRSMVVYGANPPEGGLLSDLVGYMDKDFAIAHPTIRMNTIFHPAEWEVFGVTVVDGDPLSPDAFEYDRSGFTDEEFDEFVADIRARSLFNFPTTVATTDTILLLVTNVEEEAGFENAELIVAAKRIPDTLTNSDQTTATGSVVSNGSALLPSKWTTGTTTSTTGTTGSTTGMSGTTQATTTATKAPTTTKKPTTTTTKKPTTTTKKPTTTTTKRPTSGTKPSVDASGLVTGKVKEAEFMKLFQVKDSKTGQVVKPTTAEELQMMVARLVKMELGTASFARYSTEAWKAQAVASYTYVLWYVSEYNRPYSFWFPTMNPTGSAADRKIYNAVGEVLGVKVLDTSQTNVQSMACMTTYFASSAGKTAPCHRVYWANLPYLQSVDSPYDTDEYIGNYSNGAEQWSHSFTITTAQLKKYLTEWAGEYPVGYDKKDGQPPLYAVEKDESGLYVTKTNWYYTKNSKKVYITGVQLREATGGKLWSHAFKTGNYNAQKDSFTVTTYGYGHGVGLSQMGAVGYANEAGWSYQQILKHYYSITGNSKTQLVAPKW